MVYLPPAFSETRCDVLIAQIIAGIEIAVDRLMCRREPAAE